MGERKKVLVVCPTPRDTRELPRLTAYHQVDFIYQNYDHENLEKLLYEDGHEEGLVDDFEEMIESLVATYHDGSLAGVMSSDDYPGSIIASIVAQRLNLPGPRPEKILLCQHKYYARCAQRQFVPEAVPYFSLATATTVEELRGALPFPLFVKPVKSFFSCFAQPAYSWAELVDSLVEVPNPRFLAPFNQFLKKYTPFEFDGCFMLIEGMLEGLQATIEGYVANGEVGFLGIVDSVMFPGTISFQRFEYPSRLPEDVQRRVEDIARRCMVGIGLTDSLFNIEFFYNATNDSVHIIEINPRMASQFADLYEKVDGTNSYEVQVALALGEKPAVKKRQGTCAVAASCVLREFENKYVAKVPNQNTLNEVYRWFPDLRLEIFAQEGKRLSHTLQDGKSYRYGLIHVGANSYEALEEKFQECKNKLGIVLHSL